VTWGTLSLTNVLLGVAGIIVGLLFWYAFYLLLSSFTLANPRNGFLALVKEILGLAKYPVNIYSSSIQMVFFTILPIAFVTTVPASLIIGRMGYAFLIIGMGLAILFVRFSYWVWKQNVKKYVSAGG
ncbi:ABC-2 family transporter protein, partial [Patescibacteria group bacterium]|nr:ABC-2 family transporter protein [Patescibacteria group bacterium]